jgi:S-adenosylmethionine:tRNA ribosyltransferase-isomerase
MTSFFDLEQYGYDLPEQLIAQEPLKRRDEARLMVVDRGASSIRHDVFKNIAGHVPPRSCWVVNNSKVLPARLLGQKESTGGKVEVFILKQRGDGVCEALLRPLKRLKNQDKIIFPPGRLRAEIIDRDNRLIRFDQGNLEAALRKWGRVPLPPYIKRPDRERDKVDYQTVYARRSGSVAAPTAGLHFTRPLLRRLQGLGHSFSNVTLHINYGTFKPVETRDIRRHPMHSESYAVSGSARKHLESGRKAGRAVIAVGTTSCRVLESVAVSGQLAGETSLFIYPGYHFRAVDILLTNFHLPQSTLLMLVCAFGGHELIRRAYREAVKHKYRFYSYGDAMLVV